MGLSFGGGIAFRHAELFPNTFDGYISHHGGFGLKRGLNYSECLDVTAKKRPNKIVQPILLLQSRDDNNVNLKYALDFYRKLSSDQKVNWQESIYIR